MGLNVEGLVLAIIVALLLAIIYSLRIFYLIERRIMSIEGHIEKMTQKILEEEKIIEKKIRKRK